MSEASLAVRRPALRYFGGKWRLAPWIISHLPPHLCYVEPFGGAMSVLLRKEPSYIEVYNDLDGEVVSFFRVLRERPEELLRAIELTPFSREEVARAHEAPPGDLPPEPDDELERARRLYIRSWQTRGGPRTQWKAGWRFQRRNNRGKLAIDDWNDTGHLEAVVARLKRVQIEHGDWREVVERYDAARTLFLCDPPYLPETRSERWSLKAYGCEMTPAEHAELGEMLREIDGMAVVCGYASPLYAQVFEGWRVVMKRSQTDVNTIATECLWISPKAAAAAGGRLF